MKFLWLYGILAASSMANADIHAPVHLDIESSSAQYENYIKKHRILLSSTLDSSTQQNSFQAIINLGKRNLKWLETINSVRDPDLQFTKPGSLTGVPIAKPQKYSKEIILERFDSLKKGLPDSMRKVLLEGAPIGNEVPLPENEYLEWGLKIEKLYQLSLRWQLLVPYLPQYAQRQAYDIRGVYFLNLEPNLPQTLAVYSELSNERQLELKQWLIGVCQNSLLNYQTCENEFLKNLENKNLWGFYSLYLPEAEQIYQKYFHIYNPRKDLKWEGINSPLVARISFREPNDEATRSFVKSSIESYWNWNGNGLKVDFSPTALIQMILEPGITPHVKGLGSNIIYMDQNSLFSETDTQYTIAHELGHVLGFPDCYVEFYSNQEKVMINYQIDTSNIMCSRAGLLQERHMIELRNEY